MSFILPSSIQNANSSSFCINITIITLVARDRLQTIPGFQAGIAYARKTSPNINIEYVHLDRPDLVSCAVLSYYITEMAAEYYYRRRKSSDLTVFLSPLCVGELLLFSPLATEWNVLVMATAGSDSRISNRKKYPTHLTCATHHNGFLQTFMGVLLRTLSWTSIFLLCDKNENVSNYQVTCNSMNSLLQPPVYTLTYFNFDSSKEVPDYERYLEYFATTARVMIIAAGADIVRKLMILASRRNMTGNDYAYINPYPFVQPHSYIEPVWHNNDESDEITRSAFNALLSITFDNDRYIDALPVESRNYILEKSKTEYGIDYTNGSYYGTRVQYKSLCQPSKNSTVSFLNTQISAMTVVAYESVLVTAAILQETLDELANTSQVTVTNTMQDVRGLAKRFWNRTMDLPVGRLYFNENGDYFPDVLVRQFNFTSGKFEVALRGSTRAVRQVILERSAGIVWPGGVAPLNEPLCGYTGRKSICEEGGRNRTLNAVVISVCISAALCGALGVFSVRYYLSHTDASLNWWRLAPSNIDMDELHGIGRSALKQLESQLTVGKSYRASIISYYAEVPQSMCRPDDRSQIDGVTVS